MKKVIALFCLLILVSCGPRVIHPDNFSYNAIISAAPGDIMLEWKGYDSNRYRLIFSGLTSTTINLETARENAWAIPSIQTAMVVYDLSLSKTITYKDVVLQVESANPNEIRFKVVKGPFKD